MPDMSNAYFLAIKYQDLEDALYTLKKSVYLCEDSIHKADWMQEDQSRAKWGTEEAPTSFSRTYQDFLTQLHRTIDQWASDVSMAYKRAQQAQEMIQTASEQEAAAINQMLVDQWYGQSAPAPSTNPATGAPSGLGYGVPLPGGN